MNQLIISVVVAAVLTGAAAAVMRSQTPSATHAVGAVSSKLGPGSCRSSKPLTDVPAVAELQPG